MGMHLDFTLTLQTKKKDTSPVCPLIRNHLANLWSLAQLRQPGRQLYADLTKDTFNDFLEELLSTTSL